MTMPPEDFERALRELERMGDEYSPHVEHTWDNFADLNTSYESIQDVFDGWTAHEFGRDELYEWLDTQDYDYDDFWDDFRDYYGTD